jgi:energy-coupling factor transport system permease protein
MIHPLAWLAWLVAVSAALSATRNPLHLAIVLLSIACIGAANTQQRERMLRIPPIPFISFLVVFSALINGLTVHHGQHELFSLPDWLPLLGGPITAESLIYGGLNGLTLSGIFFAFQIAQHATPTSAIVSIIPRAFYPLAVVTTIAITFVPTTLKQAQHIREAQAMRGHRLERLRDWLPMLMPLLIGGLERAFALAEAMAARGFAADTPSHKSQQGHGAISIALACLLAGWLLILVWAYDSLGLLLMLLGSLIMGYNFWRISKNSTHTRYRQIPWNHRDTAIILGALVTLLVFIAPLPALDRSALSFYPYPSLYWPAFEPRLAFGTLGLLWPLFSLRGNP